MLDDGTTGMSAIKRNGGTCIVQDPNEAEYPDMPLSILNNLEVDQCISLSQRGETIFAITQTNPKEKAAPPDVIIESEIAERVVVDYENVKQLGEKSIYAYPDCEGGLWNINKQNARLPARAGTDGNEKVGQGKPDRYRCHIGHSYSENDLVVKQGEIFSIGWYG